MIFGKLEIREHAVDTHNDTYLLHSLTAISTRRPLAPCGVMIGSLVALFGWSFADILTFGEFLTAASISTASLCIGLTLGQLRFVSRDLSSSPLSEAIWGTYGHLNQERIKIAAAVQRARTDEGAS